jgi:hypothetical protein
MWRLIAVVVAIWIAWPEDRVEVRTVHTRDVVTVPMPVAFAQTVQIPAEPARCPLGRTDAPLAQPTQPPEEIIDVRPSPTNAGWVATWNAESIFVSRNAGASWTRVLDGAGEVSDVSFDCFGRVIAIRGKRVGIRDGEHERWRTAPVSIEDGMPSRVLGGGPDIVLVAHAIGMNGVRLAISRDGGETWASHRLAAYWEGDKVRGRQYEDGTIRGAVPVTDCDSYTLFMFRLRDGELASVEHARYPRGPVETLFDKTEDGALYELEYDATVDGPVPLLVQDHEVHRVVNGKQRRTRWFVRNPYTAVGDAAGHVWNVACGKLELATARVTRGTDPRDGSSGAADAAGCDPS